MSTPRRSRATDAAPPPFARRFAELVRHRDHDVPLAEAALEIARPEYPALDVPAYLAVIDELARDAASADPGPGAPLRARLRALNDLLFGREGYAGDRRREDDPRNSYLHEVIDRRLGLPVTLSVLYLEVGRRLGLPLAGIGMPAHFLVGATGEDRGLYVDPFEGGAFLDEAGCAARLREASDGRLDMQPEFLTPTPTRRIIDRILHNLKSTYVRGAEYRKARGVVELILVLRPAAAEEIRDRGILSYQSLLFEQAVEDLERYLTMAPKAADATAIRGQVESLRRLIPSTS
jgi:regulator of sirC expression with transglutaminase-like and TPR domain